MSKTLANIVLPIDKETVNKIIAFAKGETDNAIFKVADARMDKCMFIIAHGTPDGDMHIFNQYLTNMDILSSFYRNGLRKEEIEQIYTISCFGGLQQKVEMNGIKMNSIHDEKQEIFFRFKSTSIEDKYWLCLYSNKNDYEGDR